MERYSRNLAVKGFSLEQQQILHNSSVLVIGAGGLGSAVLAYLTAAGIGSIGVVEYDTVNITNLQRQTLYCEADLGHNKGERAVARLRELNSTTNITLYNTKFTTDNGVEIASGYDIIIDCSDNYSARCAIDEVSRGLSIPFVYGSAEQLGGQIATFNSQGAGSYKELFAHPTADNSEIIGVLSPIPGIIGSLQALETIKQLTKMENNLSGKLLMFNLTTYETQIFEIH